MNIEGFNAYVDAGLSDPALWEEGTNNTLAATISDPLTGQAAAFLTSWDTATEFSSDIPVEVAEAFEVLYATFEDLAVYAALGFLVAPEWGWADLPEGPAFPSRLYVAGRVAEALADLEEDSNLASALGTILEWIDASSCASIDPPLPPGPGDTAAFCVVLLDFPVAGFNTRLGDLLTDASVTNPDLVNTRQLADLLTEARNVVVAGERTVPPQQANNWQAATEHLTNLYFYLASFDFQWADIPETVRQEIVAYFSSDTEPNPDAADAQAALTGWFLTNCGNNPASGPPTPGATPRFTG